MSQSQRNLFLSLGVVVLYLVISERLGQQYGEPTTGRQASLEEDSVGARSERRLRRSPASRAVVALMQEFGSPWSAAEYVSLLSKSEEQDPLASWKISTFALSRMSLGDLVGLRKKTLELEAFEGAKEDLLALLNEELLLRMDGDLPGFFNLLIQDGFRSRDDLVRLEAWAEDDGHDAWRWFDSLDFSQIFRSRPLAAQQARAEIFGRVIEGLSLSDLSMAARLISKERDRNLLRMIPPQVVQQFIESAVEAGNETFLRQYLAAFPDCCLTTYSEKGTSHPLWTTLVTSGWEVEEAVAFLEDLPGRQGYGMALAQIIHGDDDQSFAQKADWLGERLPETRDYHQAMGELMELTNIRGAFDRPHPGLDDWLERDSPGKPDDALLLSLLSRFDHTLNHANYWAIARRISDPDLRDRSLRKVGASWIRASPGRAKSILPPALFEELQQ